VTVSVTVSASFTSTSTSSSTSSASQASPSQLLQAISNLSLSGIQPYPTSF
jgi:hypothetical protein